MKTYILSQLAKLKKTSSDLDEKAEVEKILCGKPWHIFNDGDICETYLFEADGKLRIILGGKVSMAQWEYVEALKCVQLSLDDQQYMLQLAFSDQQLLAMKLYSGNEYCVMIEESRYAECKLKTLNDVQQYFAAIAAKQEKQLQEQKLQKEKATQLAAVISAVRVFVAQKEVEKRKRQESIRQQEQKRLKMEAERQRLYEEELNRIKNGILSAWLNSDEYKDFRKRHKVILLLDKLCGGVFDFNSEAKEFFCGCIFIFVFFIYLASACGCGAMLLLPIAEEKFPVWLAVLLCFLFIMLVIVAPFAPLWIIDLHRDKAYESYKITYRSFVEQHIGACERTFFSADSLAELNYIVDSSPSLQQLNRNA